MSYREQAIKVTAKRLPTVQYEGWAAEIVDAILAIPDPVHDPVHEAARELVAAEDALKVEQAKPHRDEGLPNPRTPESLTRLFGARAQALKDLRAALSAEPVPTPITDEMVERAAEAWRKGCLDEHGDLSTKQGMRAALDAALNGGER